MIRDFRKKRGMTLLEVLVALAVFALAGGAIITTVTNSMNGITGLQESYFSQMVADNVIAEFKLTRRWPNNSWVTSKTEFAGKTWYYRYRGQSTQDVNFKALEVEVFTDSHVNTSTPVAILKTYLHR